MAQRSQREVENALERKGFRRSDNDHRKFVYHSTDGKKTSVFTKTSQPMVMETNWLLASKGLPGKLSGSSCVVFHPSSPVRQRRSS